MRWLNQSITKEWAPELDDVKNWIDANKNELVGKRVILLIGTNDLKIERKCSTQGGHGWNQRGWGPVDCGPTSSVPRTCKSGDKSQRHGNRRWDPPRETLGHHGESRQSKHSPRPNQAWWDSRNQSISWNDGWTNHKGNKERKLGKFCRKPPNHYTQQQLQQPRNPGQQHMQRSVNHCTGRKQNNRKRGWKNQKAQDTI